MAYPASEQIKIDAIVELDRKCISVRGSALSLRNASEAGDVPRRAFAGLMASLTDLITHINNTSAITGIGAALSDQKPDFVGDVIAEAVAMRNAATALRDWLLTSLDVPWEGQVQADGQRPALVFTPAQTATFRTNADAFISTIS